MAEGKKKNETAADLALIGAAQKVEHYEMSGIVGIGKGRSLPRIA
jgi:ferritin-like metal-binding protein YciE